MEELFSGDFIKSELNWNPQLRAKGVYRWSSLTVELITHLMLEECGTFKKCTDMGGSSQVDE